MASAPNSANTAPRSRTQFWILVAVFFVPLAVAFLLYYGTQGWRPAGSTNRGDLITPARPLPQGALTAADGTDLPAELFRGKWTVVYVGDGQCDARCREALVWIRQSRLALNDDMKRVQRLFLSTANCCDSQYLQREHEGLLVARLDASSHGEQLAAEFQATIAEPLATAGRVFIVDPLGNLMMSYAPDAEPKALLQDLKRLLKLSHIG
jgi:cytochrome oxidase Cu insertion factor (SCO1/SenC/PrrC family)